MMRILVADDEPIEREALRVLVQRYLPGAEVAGEAGTGVQAVELAEQLRPDVILMDIEMPGLSGLEALAEIRLRLPVVRCVIVSAFDHFHFAREALRLGAVDYLLKPVKREQMIGLLTRLARELEGERQRRQDDLHAKEQMRQIRPLAEAELAGLLLRGEGGERRGALLEFLGMGFEAGMVMVLGLTDRSFAPEWRPAEREQKAAEAYSYLRTLAHSLCACLVSPLQGGQAALVIELEAPVDEYHTRIWSLGLGRRLRDRVKEQTGLRYRVGIGRPAGSLTEFARSHDEAVAAFHFEDVSEKVTHFGDVAGQGDPVAPGTAPDAAPPRLPARWRPTPAVLTAVDRARQYIQEHFAEEISLERAAREVSLTPYYFSKVFSRVAGETLMDHLARVRVEEAKRLLADPAVPIKEACFTVGYNDPNYFSRVFKKVTGQTPTEYRAGLAWSDGEEPL